MYDHSSDFPDMIGRSNFNRRRKKLYPYIELLDQTVSNEMNLITFVRRILRSIDPTRASLNDANVFLQ